MFLGANTPECESSRERKSRAISLRGAKVPGSEKAKERMGQGTKVPGSELASVLLANSLPGANWPGSEKAVNLLSNSLCHRLLRIKSGFYNLLLFYFHKG